jgi:hypothetical protein
MRRRRCTTVGALAGSTTVGALAGGTTRAEPPAALALGEERDQPVGRGAPADGDLAA